MPATKGTSLRLESFRKVYFYTGKHLAGPPTEYVHAYKPALKPQIWKNETAINKVEPFVEEDQSVSSLERYLWAGYALPRKSTTNIHHGGKVSWKGKGLQAVARIDEDEDLIFYVLVPITEKGLYAKMPLLVAPDKIFFFPRFRDESTNARQRKHHWIATCRKAALRMKRLLSTQRKNAAENQSTSLDSQQTPTDPKQSSKADPALTQCDSGDGTLDQQSMAPNSSERSSVEPLQANSSHDRSHVGGGIEQPLKNPLEDQSEMILDHDEINIEDELVGVASKPSTICEDEVETFKTAASPEIEPFELKVENSTQPTSHESSTDTEVREFAHGGLEDCSEADSCDDFSMRDPSPGTSSFWTYHLLKPELELVEMKQEIELDFLDAKSERECSEVKHEIKPEPLKTVSEFNDPKVEDEVKPDPEEKKPKPKLKIHPFFELKPDPNLDPRRQRTSNTPSSVHTNATAFETELLKSPTDTEWESIEQKTDSLKAAFGLTFEPLDILLVQRFLTMRKISFPEETVRDLTHLLHHKLYGFRPPRTSGARIKLIKGVIEDMVVMHYGRCLDRGKTGGAKKEEAGGEGNGRSGSIFLD